MSISVHPEKFKDYKTKDLAYKDQARELLCQHLGYDPPLRASVLSELILRSALKRLDEGNNTQEGLDDCLDFQSKVVNSVMLTLADHYNC